MKLIGESLEKITYLLRNLRREEIIFLLFKHVSLEPHFTAKQIAAARCIGVRKVLALMRSGDITPAHKAGRTNSWTAPLSAIRRYDDKTAIKLRKVDER